MYYPRMNAAIVRYCRSHGMTHSQFAALAGMSDRTLREKRFGRRAVTIDECRRISSIVGLSLNALFAECGDKDGSADFDMPRGICNA